ncbi:hypothetical protein ABK040_007590 [Willaertia magna]
MGVRHCKSSEKLQTTTHELEAPTLYDDECSHAQHVIQYHLSKFEFPAKRKFSYNTYLSNLTRDFKVLENEYNSNKQTKFKKRHSI